MQETQQIESIRMSVPQIELSENLLKSRYILKKEFELAHKLLDSKIDMKQGARVIGYLIATINLRKDFDKRHKARLHCEICGTKENLNRNYDYVNKVQQVLCDNCDADVEEMRAREVEAENLEYGS